MATDTAAQPPAGMWVPTELAERVQETMGEFLMDHGWRQQDMDTSDEFGALLAVATKAAAAPAAVAEPVAWLHDDPQRYDVIHAEVKDLLVKFRDAAGYLHRPLDKSAHYTIPLYTAPAPAAHGDALPREDFAWMVVQEACETEPADEDDPECIRILRRDLKSAVLSAFLRHDAAHPAAPVAQGDARAEQALRKILEAIREYLPPDGPSANDTIAKIVELVDPWPLDDPKGKA